MACRFDLMSAVGKVSRIQVEGFICLMKPSTSLCNYSKVTKKMEVVCEQIRGGTGELESCDQIVLILSLK